MPTLLILLGALAGCGGPLAGEAPDPGPATGADFQRQGDQVTYGDAERGFSLGGDLPAGFPLSFGPTGTLASASSSHDGGHRQHLLVVDHEASPAEVREHYVAELERVGEGPIRTRDSHTPEGGRSVQVSLSSGGEITVTVTPQDGQALATLTWTLSE